MQLLKLATSIAFVLGTYPYCIASAASIASLKSARAVTDPGLPGPYTPTNATDYVLPNVLLPGLPKAVEVLGSVVGPQGVTGLRPLVLILHGNFVWTCFTPNPADPNNTQEGRDTGWPCPAGKAIYPSYRGYRKIQDLLASQGYLTVSISANGINAQGVNTAASPDFTEMMARSTLIRLHLSQWTEWGGAGRAQAPEIIRSLPTPNMSQVLLVGHSRGGDGVNRAAMDSLTRPPNDYLNLTPRWQIRGLALIAPTSFGQNPAPDVPSVTILPGCDGEVDNLEGEMYVDATRGVSRGIALHSALFVIGANHRYFNTFWDPGDNQGHDPVCGFGSPWALTRDQHETLGAIYTAATAQLLLQADDQIRPFLDGSGVSIPSASFSSVLSHALGANRLPLLIPQSSIVITGSGSRLCEEIPSGLNTPCNVDRLGTHSPHFAEYQIVRPEAGRYAVELIWATPGQRTTLRLPTPKNIGGSESVALRIIIAAGTTGTQMEIFIVDTTGHRGSLGQFTLNGLPDSTPQGAPDWAQEVRLSLNGITAAGVNLNQVSSLEFLPISSSGRIWVIDAWGWRAGTPDPQQPALPRIDLSEQTVSKTVPGNVTFHFLIPVTGKGSGQARLFIIDPASNLATDKVVTISPGTTTVDVPITVGDMPPGSNVTYLVEAKAIQGVMIGDPIGALIVNG